MIEIAVPSDWNARKKEYKKPGAERTRELEETWKVKVFGIMTLMVEKWL